MRLLWLASLYAGAALSANAALANIADLREGMLEKLQFHDAPIAASQAIYFDPDDGEHTLAEYEGKIAVVNFWATWCAPCRVEMPSLDHLQKAFDRSDLEVVTIATGRNRLPMIEKFFAEEGLEELPILLDPKSALAKDMGVEGLPVTVVLDRNGQEIARLTGGAEWDTESALAIFNALVAE